ncbi:carbohydrate porin [Synechococcus sp. CS-1325]|uniref:carbohydrate porin n=1 Tax=Synechococcus sp. CS-1325 TaxID=2847979 RepID=UPI00223BC5DA|nr:carbohydrate porin [Synechococcus sp. CS-1325]MCT0198602.1 carbohydrate porin [Synechococcus sp. CS-1325]
MPVGLESAPALAEAESAGPRSDPGTAEPATPTPTTTPQGLTIWNRPTFSGDWWGGRSELAKRGVNLRLWATGFYQGQWSGDVGSFTAADGRGTKFLSGGRLDALVDLDTTKLGLWRGGGIHAHLELEGGRVPGFRGGALWPVNSGAILPLGSPEQLEATSLYISQRWGGTSLLVGKINAIDLLANDPFFGGWGIDRFMNLAFVAPPSGVVPPVIMGGLLAQKIGEVSLSAMVFDPSDQTTNYWVDGLFADGVNVSLAAQWNGRAWGRASNLGLSYTFSTKDSVDLRSILLPSDLQIGASTYPDNLSLQFGHTLFPSKVRPGKGIGIYGKVAATRGNPNPIGWSFVGGITGEGMFVNRPYDGFGVGFYYYNWSQALEATLDPLLPLDNEKGLEIYYNFALTPWFILTADLQLIDPGKADFAIETVAALRAKFTF